MDSLQDKFVKELSESEFKNLRVVDELDDTTRPRLSVEIDEATKHHIDMRIEEGYISGNHILESTDASLTIAHEFFENVSDAIDWIDQIDDSLSES